MQKLTKLSSNQNKLRTDEVLGEGIGEPVVGRSFTFVGESIDEEIKTQGGARFVTTSIVTEVIEKDGATEFRTLNSTYRLEVLQ